MGRGTDEDPRIAKGPTGPVIAPLILVRIQENIGYARGNNVGLRLSLANQSDYILLLNNDIVVNADSVSRLVAFAEDHPDAALLAPRLFEPDPRTGVYKEASPLNWRRRPSFWDFTIFAGLTARARERSDTADWAGGLRGWQGRLYYAPGCALMFRANTLRQAGLFDERTFLYYEEYILAERLRTLGLRTYWVPDASVWHRKGATTRRMADASRYANLLLSEMYYLAAHRRLDRAQLLFIRLQRTLGFWRRMAVDKSFRSGYAEFARRYWGSRYPTPYTRGVRSCYGKD